jgi:hypothetical protein
MRLAYHGVGKGESALLYFPVVGTIVEAYIADTQSARLDFICRPHSDDLDHDTNSTRKVQHGSYSWVMAQQR